jgi:spermidine synthase
MTAVPLFLAAYACSGFAALVYEVAWTRLLALYMGHSTAATSTVVAAFMGGLAAGAAIGGRVATRLSRRHALYGYAALELAVAVTALSMPLLLTAIGPALAWAYRDGAPGVLFPVARIALCFAVLLVPTMALGATFPFGIRWLVSEAASAGRLSGALYAANTAGAAGGALASAFLLIPSFGISGATLVAVTAGALAIAFALVTARMMPVPEHPADVPAPAGATGPAHVSKSAKRFRDRQATDDPPPPRWLGPTVLALTGVATFLLEIAWTRVFASAIGPSTFAFAAILTGVISGLAAGSATGAVIAGRRKRPSLALVLALGGAALAATWVSSYAGREFPALVLDQVARSGEPFGRLLIRHSMIVAGLVAPAAFGLGVAYALALAITAASGEPDTIARRLGSAYAINTLASVAGSLAAGFATIPLLGLHGTLRAGSAFLVIAAVTAAAASRLSTRARVTGLLPAAAALVAMVAPGGWDRELLASGGYKYAARVPKDVDLATALKAGRLLYYREGPTGIVSVKMLTGDRSLAIDGKVDASTSGDMLTQKALAHLPLLLHEDPHTVCIIGLGSGVTLASALRHPVSSVDVVEISPEVVEAAQYFAAENHDALKDPRSRLIVGDGRSHLAWASKQYDVIISEPSNPWMAGVAALFTREFFAAVRDRLARYGIICQWAHTYDISDADLKSIVETFRSVFPNGTMWLVGDGDLLLIGSAEPLDPRLPNIETNLRRAGVADDLRGVQVEEPFALWSLFVGGADELTRFGAGAPYQTDDRMALEFSGPSSINSTSSSNVQTLRGLLDGHQRPSVIERALSTAGAREWRNRAGMLLEAGSYGEAYEDYVKALTYDPTDQPALSGMVRASVASHREAEAIQFLKNQAALQPRAAAPRVSLSRLLAATGAFEDAVSAAREAIAIQPADPDAFDQFASLFSDAADAAGLDDAVSKLRQLFPQRATTFYYGAAWQFLRGRLAEALTLIRQAIELDPKRASSHNLLGAIQANLGQQQLARDAFQTALGLDRRDVTAYSNLALLELSAGNRESAVDLFAEALALDPASAAVRQGLAQAR